MPTADADTDELLALAAENQGNRAALITATVTAALATWSQVQMGQILASWFTAGLGARIYTLLSASQESTASESAQFVAESLRVQGYPTPEPPVNPAAFAGIASDGRDLESLLVGAPAQALQRLRRGDSPAVAAKVGADFIRRVVPTQIADAGRAADQVAIVAAIPEPRRRRRPVRVGWARMLNPPSCSRCIVLAGRVYRWNDGFLRHECCDCSHIPVAEDVAGDVVTDPDEYFASLSKSEQDEVFGKANAKAIRAGASLSQVVNATTRGGVRTAQGGYVYTLEGTSRRGLYGKRAGGVLRPTPSQIYRDANGDQDEAVRLLKRFKYLR